WIMAVESHMKSPSGVSAVGIAPGKPAASACGLVPAKRRRTYGMPLYSKYPVIFRVKYDCVTPCRRNGFIRRPLFERHVPIVSRPMESAVVRKILAHLGLPRELPNTCPARPPATMGDGLGR